MQRTTASRFRKRDTSLWRSTRVAGFSLLEIAISIAVTTTTLAGLAPVFLQSTAMIAEARDETDALLLAASRLEQLVSLPFEQDSVSLVPVNDETTNLGVSPPDTSGFGLRPGDPSTAWRDTPGYFDVVHEDGTPAEQSAGPGTFVRRWSIGEIAGPAGVERRFVQVMARALARERREGTRDSLQRRRADVWLFSVRARVLR